MDRFVKRNVVLKYKCPCCGYYTIPQKPPGTDHICNVCFWHDDYVQFYDPDFEGGANEASLNQAKKNFIEFGACEFDLKKYVRHPKRDEKKGID